MTGLTDNLGNSHAVVKGMSTKFPLAALLIELSEQLRVRALDLRLSWVRRDENVEADAITNQDFGRFSEERRIKVNYPEVKWQVLHEILEASKSIFDQVSAQRQRDKEERLRLKDGTSSEGSGTKSLKRKWSGKSGPNLRRSNPW